MYVWIYLQLILIIHSSNGLQRQSKHDVANTKPCS